MNKSNIFLYGTKILAEFVKDLIFFPFWWYTKGLKKFFILLGKFIQNMNKIVAVSVWIKNLFVPMFGQRDIQGRLVSFFMRLFQIIVRSIFFFVILILTAAIMLLYLVSPIFIIYEIIYQLT